MRAHGPSLAWLALATALAPSGCGPDLTPQLAPIGTVQGYVGAELSFMLRATPQRAGDSVSFDYQAPEIKDLKQRRMHPTLTAYGEDTAIFRWTPMVNDVGNWNFDFSAVVGSAAGHQNVSIGVSPAQGSAGPVFREPSGTGTTIDPSMTQCFQFDIVTEDTDATRVAIGQADPPLPGAMMSCDASRQDCSFQATFRYCPPQGQQEAAVVLTADDGNHPVATKSYLLVVLGGSGGNCPGAAPQISHVPPGDQVTSEPIEIDALVSDDLGISGPPLVYWSLRQPSNPPNLAQMTLAEMELLGGDARDGSYRTLLPNPVAQSGGSAELYYVIVARDHDDPHGSCDHMTGVGPYAMRVTAGDGTLVAYCGFCVDDSQCGNNNLCARPNGSNDAFCLADCEQGQICPTGTSCSLGPIVSVDGASRRQCLPWNGCSP
jgi:hypothetical protein